MKKYLITDFSEYAKLEQDVFVVISKAVASLQFPFVGVATDEMSIDFDVPIVRLDNGEELSLAYFDATEIIEK